MTDADASDGGTDAMVCVGSGLLHACFAPPTSPMTVGNLSFDDTADARCTYIAQTGGDDVCAVIASDLTVSGILRVVGPHPLALIATGTLRIEGTVDVSSNQGSVSAGAGADPSPCDTTNDSPTANGGGAGGTFASIGGFGGKGNTSNAGGAPDTLIVAPTFVRGGCRGGTGGVGTLPGFGGGAVYLAAATAIVIDGTVSAAGEGGHGSVNANASGGAAGGSGGLVGIDGPSVTIAATAVLLALGGGGAGGTGTANNPGLAGQDPSTMPPLAVASGGSGSSGGAAGGGGSSTAGGNASNGANSLYGGGGGGGGAGLIVVYSSATAMNASTAVAPPLKTM